MLKIVRITVFVVLTALFAGVIAAYRAEAAGKKSTEARGAAATAAITFPDKTIDDKDLLPGIKTREDYEVRVDGPSAKEGPSLAAGIWRMIFSLALVILMIVGVIYLLRRVWARGMRFDLKGHHIRVLDVVSLGMNRSIFLVAIGKKVVLLGSNDKGLSFLTEVTGLENIEEAESLPMGGGGVSFQGELENAALQNMLQNNSIQDRTVPFVDKLKSKLKKLEEEKQND